MRRIAVILAGGKASRFDQAIPKQFQEVLGKALWKYSYDAFREFDDSIELVLVLPQNEIEQFNKEHLDTASHVLIVSGGESRSDSVRNALMAIEGDAWIYIHDAARPMLNSTLLRRLTQDAEKYGSAVPCIGVSDSLRRISIESSEVVDRNEYRLIQTPQVFRLDKLRNKMRGQVAFDDESAYFRGEVHLSEGDPHNFKITRGSDMKLFEALLKSQNEG